MLTPRLECIIKYAAAETAADIGTDHAYVSIELIKRNKAKKVIAADIRKGPLDIARANIEKNNLSNKIETRLGSGLSVLKPGEADLIIIAGMGGELICDILSSDMDAARKSRLILQPMNSQYELRKWLHDNDFSIINEDIECEGERVYNVIIAESGRQDKFETDIEYHLPKYLYNNEKFYALCNKKKREFEKIINGLEKSDNIDENKLYYYKKRLEDLKNNIKFKTEDNIYNENI